MPVKDRGEFVRSWCLSLTAFPPSAEAGWHLEPWGQPGVQPEPGLRSPPPGTAGPEPGAGGRGGARGSRSWERLRNTEVVRPMAKEARSEQEGPEEDGMPEMTSASWEKRDIVRALGGDRGEAAEMLAEKTSVVTRVSTSVRVIRELLGKGRTGVKILVREVLQTRKKLFQENSVLQKNRKDTALLQAALKP